MPGTPATSTRFGAPRYSNADAVDFAGQVNAVTDAFDAKAALAREALLTPAQFLALPAQTDGTVVRVLLDQTVGVIVTLRLRKFQSDGTTANPSASKWEVVGVSGTGLYAAVETSQALPDTGAVYIAAPTTPGPALALPLAGDYMVAHGFSALNQTAAAQSRMSYDIGATPAADADSVECGPTTATTGGYSVSREKLKTGLGAVTLTAKYIEFGTGTLTISRRWIRATPVRVTGPAPL